MESLCSQNIIWRLLRFICALSLISGHVGCLSCWKCVGEMCSGEEFEKFSHKVHCAEGESCMKVVFEMVDYPSPIRYESVVRTCSSGPCVPITMKTFYVCRGKTRSYRFNGCAIRTCCEKDFCNKATRVFDSDFRNFLFTFILIVFNIVYLY